jgi:hypothetical protein
MPAGGAITIMMKNETILKLREKIRKCIPQDYLQLKPNTPGHVYYDPRTGAEFISVTSKLHIISNPIFAGWRMNRALEYMFDHKDEINKDNFNDYVKKAKEYPEILFEEAGKFGTKVHGYIHLYFTQWILDNRQPSSILHFIDGTRTTKETDFRVWSALRSLEAWVNKNGYVPLASEIIVWSQRYHLAGTMDNVGVDKTGRVGFPDWKTSNNFSDNYHAQVGAYYGAFYELTHIRGEWGKIVKLDKERGDPEEESLDNLRSCFKTFMLAAHLYDDIQNIRFLRKPDNKVRI